MTATVGCEIGMDRGWQLGRQEWARVNIAEVQVVNHGGNLM